MPHDPQYDNTLTRAPNFAIAGSNIPAPGELPGATQEDGRPDNGLLELAAASIRLDFLGGNIEERIQLHYAEQDAERRQLQEPLFTTEIFQKYPELATPHGMQLLTGAKTEREAFWLNRILEQERTDRDTTETAGWPGIFSRIGAGVISPENLIPMGYFFKGAKTIGQFAKAGAKSATVGVGIGEAGLQALQLERPYEESVFAMMAAPILGGALGSLGGAINVSREKMHGKMVNDLLRGYYNNASGIVSDMQIPVRVTDVAEQMTTDLRKLARSAADVKFREKLTLSNQTAKDLRTKVIEKWDEAKEHFLEQRRAGEIRERIKNDDYVSQEDFEAWKGLRKQGREGVVEDLQGRYNERIEDLRRTTDDDTVVKFINDLEGITVQAKEPGTARHADPVFQHREREQAKLVTDLEERGGDVQQAAHRLVQAREELLRAQQDLESAEILAERGPVEPLEPLLAKRDRIASRLQKLLEQVKTDPKKRDLIRLARSEADRLQVKIQEVLNRRGTFPEGGETPVEATQPDPTKPVEELTVIPEVRDPFPTDELDRIGEHLKTVEAIASELRSLQRETIRGNASESGQRATRAATLEEQRVHAKARSDAAVQRAEEEIDGERVNQQRGVSEAGAQQSEEIAEPFIGPAQTAISEHEALMHAAGEASQSHIAHRMATLREEASAALQMRDHALESIEQNKSLQAELELALRRGEVEDIEKANGILRDLETTLEAQRTEVGQQTQIAFARQAAEDNILQGGFFGLKKKADARELAAAQKEKTQLLAVRFTQLLAHPGEWRELENALLYFEKFAPEYLPGFKEQYDIYTGRSSLHPQTPAAQRYTQYQRERDIADARFWAGHSLGADPRVPRDPIEVTDEFGNTSWIEPKVERNYVDPIPPKLKKILFGDPQYTASIRRIFELEKELEQLYSKARASTFEADVAQEADGVAYTRDEWGRWSAYTKRMSKHRTYNLLKHSLVRRWIKSLEKPKDKPETIFFEDLVEWGPDRDPGQSKFKDDRFAGATRWAGMRVLVNGQEGFILEPTSSMRGYFSYWNDVRGTVAIAKHDFTEIIAKDGVPEFIPEERLAMHSNKRNIFLTPRSASSRVEGVPTDADWIPKGIDMDKVGIQDIVAEVEVLPGDPREGKSFLLRPYTDSLNGRAYRMVDPFIEPGVGTVAMKGSRLEAQRFPEGEEGIDPLALEKTGTRGLGVQTTEEKIVAAELAQQTRGEQLRAEENLPRTGYSRHVQRFISGDEGSWEENSGFSESQGWAQRQAMRRHVDQAQQKMWALEWTLALHVKDPAERTRLFLQRQQGWKETEGTQGPGRDIVSQRPIDPRDSRKLREAEQDPEIRHPWNAIRETVGSGRHFHLESGEFALVRQQRLLEEYQEVKWIHANLVRELEGGRADIEWGVSADEKKVRTLDHLASIYLYQAAIRGDLILETPRAGEWRVIDLGEGVKGRDPGLLAEPIGEGQVRREAQGLVEVDFEREAGDEVPELLETRYEKIGGQSVRIEVYAQGPKEADPTYRAKEKYRAGPSIAPDPRAVKMHREDMPLLERYIINKVRRSTAEYQLLKKARGLNWRDPDGNMVVGALSREKLPEGKRVPSRLPPEPGSTRLPPSEFPIKKLSGDDQFIIQLGFKGDAERYISEDLDELLNVNRAAAYRKIDSDIESQAAFARGERAQDLTDKMAEARTDPYAYLNIGDESETVDMLTDEIAEAFGTDRALTRSMLTGQPLRRPGDPLGIELDEGGVPIADVPGEPFANILSNLDMWLNSRPRGLEVTRERLVDDKGQPIFKPQQWEELRRRSQSQSFQLETLDQLGERGHPFHVKGIGSKTIEKLRDFERGHSGMAAISEAPGSRMPEHMSHAGPVSTRTAEDIVASAEEHIQFYDPARTDQDALDDDAFAQHMFNVTVQGDAYASAEARLASAVHDALIPREDPKLGSIDPEQWAIVKKMNLRPEEEIKKIRDAIVGAAKKGTKVSSLNFARISAVAHFRDVDVAAQTLQNALRELERVKAELPQRGPRTGAMTPPRKAPRRGPRAPGPASPTPHPDAPLLSKSNAYGYHMQGFFGLDAKRFRRALRINSKLRMITSEHPQDRALIQHLTDFGPIWMEQYKAGVPKEASVESAIQSHWRGKEITYLREVVKGYTKTVQTLQGREVSESPGIAEGRWTATKQGASKALGKSYDITPGEFSERILSAIRNERSRNTDIPPAGQDPLDEVTRLAKMWDTEFQQPMRQELRDIGRLKNHMLEDYDTRWSMRVWNIEKVEANRDQWITLATERLVAGDKNHPSMEPILADRTARNMHEQILAGHEGRLDPELFREKKRNLGAPPTVPGTDAEWASDGFLINDMDTVMQFWMRTIPPDLELSKLDAWITPDRIKNIPGWTPDPLLRKNIEKLTLEKLDYANSFPDGPRRRSLMRQAESGRKDTEATIDLLRNVYGQPKNPNGKLLRFSQGLRKHNYMSDSGTFMLSALPDGGRPIMVYGLGKVYGTGIKTLLTDLDTLKLNMREAELSGAGGDLFHNHRTMELFDLGSPASKKNRFERFQTRAVEEMSILNGLSVHNHWIKKWVGVIASQRIVDFCQIVSTKTRWDGKAATKGEYDEAVLELSRAGISTVDPNSKLVTGDSDAVKIWEQVRNNPVQNRLRVLNTEDWGSTHRGMEAREKFRSALNSAIETTINTPRKGDRPLIMTKEFGRQAFMYKSFSLASTMQTVIPGLQQPSVSFLTGASVAVGFSLLSLYAKARLGGWTTPGWDTEEGFWWWMRNAVDRAGFTGIFSDMNSYLGFATNGQATMGNMMGLGPDREFRYSNRNWLTETIGPSASTAWDVWKVGAGVGDALLFDTQPPERAWNALRRQVWLNNHFLVNSLFRKVFKGMYRQTRRDFADELWHRQPGDYYNIPALKEAVSYQ